MYMLSFTIDSMTFIGQKVECTGKQSLVMKIKCELKNIILLYIYLRKPESAKLTKNTIKNQNQQKQESVTLRYQILINNIKHYWFLSNTMLQTSVTWCFIYVNYCKLWLRGSSAAVLASFSDINCKPGSILVHREYKPSQSQTWKASGFWIHMSTLVYFGQLKSL